ncbi:zinc finger, CCHC-type containing protein [Tanacetum coccineum]|uniref:Zinc finger, CCHC-type containing protein n=1 Tax=Tanacetum coccineum TaxID=301880 RepID=A0ABQ4XC67_9ASTR
MVATGPFRLPHQNQRSQSVEDNANAPFDVVISQTNASLAVADKPNAPTAGWCRRGGDGGGESEVEMKMVEDKWCGVEVVAAAAWTGGGGCVGSGDDDVVYDLNENQINHKVKTIRCDNGTEFKNNDMNQFCGVKRIKREFSVARSPQQNGVAERKNMSLIEAARTMLADSLLPTTFWAKAVNTACYVQNRVLVTKPHNKTPYELLLDPLGKFNGKADEGFLVRYSINSKAFRVFNTRTRKVEENLHIKVLENKPNVARSGPEWLFDIDSLTKSMNYEPITVKNQTNGDAGIETNVNVRQARLGGRHLDLNTLLLPLMLLILHSLSSHAIDNKDADEVPGKGDDDLNERIDQERIDSSTKDVNTTRPSINTASENINIGSPNINTASPILNDSSMQSLENIGIFDDAYDDREVGAEADLNNLETTMNVSPIPTTRIYKDHPKDQIIKDINSATQTRRMTQISEEHAMVYRNKKDIKRGIVVRNKARLVAQGYTQEEGIDYDEVFAPVARIEAIRGDETIYKEWEDRMERAATTVSSLEAEHDSGSGPRCQDTILGGVKAQTRFEAASKQSNDPPLSRVNILGSGEDSMKLKELMEHYTQLSELIQALVDKKKVIISETSIRSDLKLDDAKGINCLPTAIIFAELERIGCIMPKSTDVDHHDTAYYIPMYHRTEGFTREEREVYKSLVNRLFHEGRVILPNFLDDESNLRNIFAAAMVEEDALLVDYVESGLCVDNTNAAIGERCNSGSDKDKGKILGQYTQHGLKMDESISISSSELDKFLIPEESLRAQDNDKGKGKEAAGPSVNMTEEDKSKNNKQNKGKKRDFKEHGSGSGSNQKPKLECWKCSKTGHFKMDCRSGNKKNANAGGSGKGSKDHSQDQGQNLVHVWNGFVKYPVSLISFEALMCRRLMQFAWWIDSGATTHVCKEIVVGFKTYAPVEAVLFLTAVVRLPDPKKKTLGEKGIDCIFVGYAEHSKAYRFYVIEPNDSVSINSIIESIDAIFDENRLSSIPRPKDIIPNSDESQRDDHSDDVPSKILEPRKVGSQYSYCYGIKEDPRTYNEAMPSRDSTFWKEAIDDEIGSIMENNTWILSDLPHGCKPLGCKWIFKRKMKVDGTIDKFKARLVIQGFRQKEGIDYFDTYAPVSRITTIRLLLALAAIHNLVIHQMDVETAFLNGDLDEEVYMKQQKGFVMPGNEHKFSMKDMGEVDVILGIKIKHENKGIVFTQSHYIEKILNKFNREDCSPESTPMDPVEKLKPNIGKPVDQLKYSRAIGCLMYAMTSTRPDIAYAVGRLSRFTSNPSRQHWQAITRVFKYLKGTMNYGLSYMGYPSVLEGYSDASWINHVEDSSSTSGWVFLLGGGAISWASKKQTCITGSTMESEFVALAAAGKEAEWLRNLIHEIPIWPKPIAPISIRCDSAPTMAKAYSQIYNGKSRHLGVRHSMIRELIMNGVISIEFVRSQKNLADHLTKGLARDLVNKSVIGMGLKSI